MTGKEVQKWADSAMFKAQEIDAAKGPEVFLLACNNDPLGSIAAAALAYTGVFVESLADITDEQRRYYLGEVQKTALAMPLEAVNLHFRIRGVTRGFTHQLVRQRTAAFSQESTRFAVKESVPVALPPSLMNTDPDAYRKEVEEFINDHKGKGRSAAVLTACANDYAYMFTSKEDRWRHKWDTLMGEVERVYNELVNDGMPAEDARGCLPTNLLTQVNYFTNLRGLKDHAGMRLCTQAQFEWRQVWTQIIQAIRNYGIAQVYNVADLDTGRLFSQSSSWQFDALADIFRPDCYYKGKCTFKADFDRKCSIRDRVDANAEINRPSTYWHIPFSKVEVASGDHPKVSLGIPAIRPAEWLLDPSAAR